jgi:hypothetical protein
MSTCNKPTQEDVNKYCNRRNGLGLLNLVPIVGPVISNAAGNASYFKGKIGDYQKELNNASSKYDVMSKQWVIAISNLAGENTQNIHNLINLLFTGGSSNNGYIGAIIDKKTFPLWEFAGYTGVTVVCIIIILSVLIINE